MLVGVDGVPTSSTGEHRLCGAVLGCGVPAGFAAVGGVPRVDVDHHTSSLFRSGAQDRHELGPARVVDAWVQAGLGRGPVGQEPARLVGIGARWRSLDQVADPQVLDDQQVVADDEARAVWWWKLRRWLAIRR
jgi:hypothetical protein